jgi:hypothetical protein
MFLVELNNIYVRLRTHISNWTTYQFIIKKLNTPFGFLLFLLLALGVAFILSQFNAKIGLILFILSIGIGVILICIYKLELSFFIAILLSPLFYVTSKYFLQVVPIGVAIDGLLFWGLLLILLHQISLRSRQWTFMINPISLSIVVYLLYIFVQGFNPNLDSIESYFSVNRRLFSYLSGYLIVSYCFTSIAFLKRFIGFWLIFGFLTGLYGCYQEWFGLLDFEYRWINAVESAFNLIYIDGRFRVFSFHVGPASFGTFMAMTGIISFILALGPFKKLHRLIFFIVGVITSLGIL